MFGAEVGEGPTTSAREGGGEEAGPAGAGTSPRQHGRPQREQLQPRQRAVVWALNPVGAGGEEEAWPPSNWDVPLNSTVNSIKYTVLYELYELYELYYIYI